MFLTDRKITELYDNIESFIIKRIDKEMKWAGSVLRETEEAKLTDSQIRAAERVAKLAVDEHIQYIINNPPRELLEGLVTKINDLQIKKHP